MDIHPSVDIISLEKTASFSDMTDALESYRWMFKDLTEEEDQKLKEYIESNSTKEDNGTITVNRSYPSRWALIWWKTTH